MLKLPAFLNSLGNGGLGIISIPLAASFICSCLRFAFSDCDSTALGSTS